MSNVRILLHHQYSLVQVCKRVLVSVLLVGLLSAISMYAEDADGVVSGADDQWLILEEAQEDLESDPATVIYNAQWNIQGLWQAQAEHTTPLSPVSDEDPIGLPGSS